MPNALHSRIQSSLLCDNAGGSRRTAELNKAFNNKRRLLLLAHAFRLEEGLLQMFGQGQASDCSQNNCRQERDESEGKQHDYVSTLSDTLWQSKLLVMCADLSE